jgi:hypothetical protein
MAATHRDAVLWARLGEGDGDRFDRAVWAWTFAGAAGVDVLQDAWSPPPAEVARGRAAIAGVFSDDAPDDGRGDAPDDGPGDAPDGGPDDAGVLAVAVWRNRFTVEARDVQVRLGRDGLWYPYRRRAGGWWPGGPPGRDAGAVVGDLLAQA